MAENPLAGASGPGKFSKRTDLPSTSYGEGVETNAIKNAAPLAETPSARPMSRSAMASNIRTEILIAVAMRITSFSA